MDSCARGARAATGAASSRRTPKISICCYAVQSIAGAAAQIPRLSLYQPIAAILAQASIRSGLVA